MRKESEKIPNPSRLEFFSLAKKGLLFQRDEKLPFALTFDLSSLAIKALTCCDDLFGAAAAIGFEWVTPRLSGE